MNDWTPLLGENLSTRSEPKNEIDKYAVAVTKDVRVVVHLKKGKTDRYVKLFSTSYELIQWTLLVLLSQERG